MGGEEVFCLLYLGVCRVEFKVGFYVEFLFYLKEKKFKNVVL